MSSQEWVGLTKIWGWVFLCCCGYPLPLCNNLFSNIYLNPTQVCEEMKHL